MDYVTTPKHRTATIAGLRELADRLEDSEALPLPSLTIDWYLFADAYGTRQQSEQALAAQRTEAARLVRILGTADKRETGNLFRYVHRFGGPDGFGAEVIVDRPAVCERVVTGTSEVKRTVPIGDDTRPTTTVTDVVENVTWECRPLLGTADDVAPGPVGAHVLPVGSS